MPAENLFIIGDIEAYGFDQAFQEVWGDFDESGKLRGVLLRYNQNYIPYAPGAFDVEGFTDIILKDSKATMVSGLTSIAEAVVAGLEGAIRKKRTFYYAKCENNNQLDIQLKAPAVQEATLGDVDRIIALHESIPEFSESQRNRESLIRSMQTGVARTFYIEEDGHMVSSSSTTAENRYAAMIVGVCTAEAYKKKGYATACLTTLTQTLLDENKTLCLFYDNPEAGKIYKRLGFVDIGTWGLYYLG
nr:GNAT family N-acetyltransferase [Pullulanibacillus pueri]